MGQIVVDDALYDSKKQHYLMNLVTLMPFCKEAYVALARDFKEPLQIHNTLYTSKESLYLKALEINPEYSRAYFLLGKELFIQKKATVQLLNKITLSCKQLFMRVIQLGTYEAEAYHFAAVSMQEKDAVLLFDHALTFSRKDLFIRAFGLDPTRITDLKNFIFPLKNKDALSKK
ncbi:MAG: hypothetical protein QRY72_01645 [Candidatus Rhabdochlamydia sp.]